MKIKYCKVPWYRPACAKFSLKQTTFESVCIDYLRLLGNCLIIITRKINCVNFVRLLKPAVQTTKTLSKVFPSPGAAQSVWGLDSGTGQSCSMVSANAVTEQKDSNILSCSESTDFNNVGHNSKSVFDLVRYGYVL